MRKKKVYYLISVSCLLMSILWTLFWELKFAPLYEGGSLMVLKSVILLIPMRGMLHGKVYTFKWGSMILLFILAESVFRLVSDPEDVQRLAAGVATLLLSLSFLGAVMYCKCFKSPKTVK